MSERAKLEMYGASDDLVEVRGDVDDEYGAWGGWSGFVRNSDGGAVHVTFQHHDSWAVTVRQVDEEPIPPRWVIVVEQSPDVAYSPVLRFWGPDAGTFTVQPEAGDDE